MTKKQLIKKMNELKKENNKFINKKVERILKSGAIDLKSWDDDFRMPKVLMTAICEDLVFQWKPLDKELRKEVQNISSFI